MSNLHLYTLLEVKRVIEHVDETSEDSGEAFMSVKNWVNKAVERRKQFLLEHEEREA